MITVGIIPYNEKTDEDRSLINFIVMNNPYLAIKQVMDPMLLLPVGRWKHHHLKEVDSEKEVMTAEGINPLLLS